MSEASLITRLNVYRDAVEVRTFWQEYGTHGDGNLDQALHAEAIARQSILDYFVR